VEFRIVPYSAFLINAPSECAGAHRQSTRAQLLFHAIVAPWRAPFGAGGKGLSGSELTWAGSGLLASVWTCKGSVKAQDARPHTRGPHILTAECFRSLLPLQPT